MQRRTKIGCIVIIIAIMAIFATIFLPQFLILISAGNNNVTSTSLDFEGEFETYRPSYNTTDGWYNRVTIPAQLHIYGTIINKEDKILYNCQLHIIGYYAGGIVALDKYVDIGVGTQNAIYVNGQIPIDLTINCPDGITNWKVTPFCTNNP
jgi:hypothetical protein